MMTDKTVLHFQLAQKYSNIQILMPRQIASLMIQKGTGFANLYNEGHVLAGTLGFQHLKFYVLLKGVYYMTVSFFEWLQNL